MIFAEPAAAPRPSSIAEFREALAAFDAFGERTRIDEFPDPSVRLPVFVNEFWTSKQRAAHSLHEISYRACFKPQLPRFFVERLTDSGDRVHDPFMGRGTTLVEAALLGRRVAGCDANPLSRILVESRLAPPDPEAVRRRLAELDLSDSAFRDAFGGADEFAIVPREDLLAFYHPDTLAQILALRRYLAAREADGALDPVDRWIRTVATNRLTGHSPGFFSVYTMPPNQAVSAATQRKINARREQTPPPRDAKRIVLRKSDALLKDSTPEERGRLRAIAAEAILATGSCERTPEIPDDSVALVVTSPPFLDVVDYRADNWLRCWFNGIDAATLPNWQYRKEADWIEAMTRVFRELSRALVPGGFVAFEVGEVRGGKLPMETLVVPAARAGGLVPELVLVNAQNFTKTANCWGVSNGTKGTNTNRVVLLSKPE